MVVSLVCFRQMLVKLRYTSCDCLLVGATATFSSILATQAVTVY